MALYYKKRNDDAFELEVIEGERALKFLYETPLGKMSMGLLIKRKWISGLYGWLQDRPRSKNKIDGFVKKHDIHLEEAERSSFETFNDFFTRKLKKEARPISKDPMAFISPADGRLFAYENINIEALVQLKGMMYSLRDLIGEEALAQKYSGGTCLVIRLSPVDYHRFHYPADGQIVREEKIDGHYFSVNPIALSKLIRLYVQNKREWMLLKTERFKEVLMMEVGATCVGTIIQNNKVGDLIKKGDEKGYFKFGGSTVILFLEKNAVTLDDDLIKNTLEGYETKVHMGEQIGVQNKNV